MKSKHPAQKKRFISPFIFTVLTTIGIGVVFLASFSQVYSKDIYNNPYQLIFLHLSWVALGLIAFFFFFSKDYHFLSKYCYILFLITLGFLAALAASNLIGCEADIPFAPCIKGARRWFYFNPAPMPALPFLGVLGFQPGEFSKLVLILYLAFQLPKAIRRGQDPFTVYLVSTLLFSVLIVLQPNMSTAATVLGIGTITFFCSGASVKKLLYLAPIMFLILFLLIVFSPYRRARLVSLLAGGGKEESSYHVKQILISLGSGGITGVGYGQSKQKYNYLPESTSDSVYAIIGEEFGFVGTVGILGLFLYLIYLGFSISKKAMDIEGTLISVGVISWIGLQFFVNAAAMVKIIPLTGVPIPLLSYGGSSTVFSLAALGILASVERVSLK